MQRPTLEDTKQLCDLEMEIYDALPKSTQRALQNSPRGISLCKLLQNPANYAMASRNLPRFAYVLECKIAAMTQEKTVGV